MAAYKHLACRATSPLALWRSGRGLSCIGASPEAAGRHPPDLSAASLLRLPATITLSCGEAAARLRAKLRIEGKEYVVEDGDAMHFRFNV